MSERIDEIESRLREMGRPSRRRSRLSATADQWRGLRGNREVPPRQTGSIGRRVEETTSRSSAGAGRRSPAGGDVPRERPERGTVAASSTPQGELRVPDGYHVLSGGVDGRRAVGIVVSRYNGEITNRLLERALAELEEVGVPREAIMVMAVPGAFELPLAAMALAKTRRYACIVALGCVIRGRDASLRPDRARVGEWSPAGGDRDGRARRVRRAHGR